jgi:hypothetical protein
MTEGRGACTRPANLFLADDDSIFETVQFMGTVAHCLFEVCSAIRVQFSRVGERMQRY